MGLLRPADFTIALISLFLSEACESYWTEGRIYR